jgi:pilus assembly protein CpaF
MSFKLILPFLRSIEPLLLDESVSEILGNPDASWWCEGDGIIERERTISFDAGKLRAQLEVIANQLGKRLDERNPLLDARLTDRSRLAAGIPPVADPAPVLAIRKFTSRHYTVDDPIVRSTLTRPLADFLAEPMRGGKALLIMGGTGTGKTTLFERDFEDSLKTPRAKQIAPALRIPRGPSSDGKDAEQPAKKPVAGVESMTSVPAVKP